MLLKNCLETLRDRNVLFFVFFITFFLPYNLSAEPGTTPGEIVASDTKNVDNFGGNQSSGKRAKQAISSVASTKKKATKPTSSYTTNELTKELQAAIEKFNQEFTNEPITFIDENNLSRLVKYDLISPRKLKEFLELVMINGEVYAKKTDASGTDTIPITDNDNLFGDFERACQAIDDGKSRGESHGNKSPKKRLDWNRGQLTFRDKYGSLVSHDYTYPVVNMVSPVRIKGKRYKNLKNFVTSILMKRNRKWGLWRRKFPWFKNPFRIPLKRPVEPMSQQR